MAGRKTSILYRNQTKDVFLVDIPASISLAQCLSPYQNAIHPSKRRTHSQAEPEPEPGHPRKCILSTPPTQTPYSTPSEPKTEKARAKVQERIPLPERVFHEDVIMPLVTEALAVIRQEWTGDWCLERCTVPDGIDYDCDREYGGDGDSDDDADGPPVILSSTSENVFSSMRELRGVPVQNTSMESAVLVSCEEDSMAVPSQGKGRYLVPPLSTFLLSTVLMHPTTKSEVIPGLPRSQKFNLILLDPPWPNRSAQRSGHYHTQSYTEIGALTRTITRILRDHLVPDPGPGPCIAGIWVTNSYKARMAAYEAIQDAGLVVAEEWAWVKTAVTGETILPVTGVWRKPYEILVIGFLPGSGSGSGSGDRDHDKAIMRRVVAAVPDVHSRKPNLKQVFEEVFFAEGCPRGYSALEVFARNLTAGWWGCGDEVLRFNSEEWWK